MAAVHSADGLTPTCVGSTHANVLDPTSVRTHPHVRGEHVTASGTTTANLDSPPRAWGAHRLGVVRAGLERLTPTCVGSTQTFKTAATSTRTHPHVRGEHARRHGRDRRQARLTPTCVGSTPSQPTRSAAATTHPHVRGEHASPLSATRIVPDSPPRAWGARTRARWAASRAGLTPTCVGSTSSSGPLRRRRWTHPHVRGEHDGDRFTGAGGYGLTPTCVGSTAVLGDTAFDVTTHPHVRGEHTPSWIDDDYNQDSPPRAWGAPRRRDRDLRAGGLTPTCVGSTLRD